LPTLRDNLSVPYSRVFFLDSLILEDGKARLSRNVRNNLQSTLRIIAEYQRSHLHRDVLLKSPNSRRCFSGEEKFEITSLWICIWTVGYNAVEQDDVVVTLGR
jgi:hypothetical protein